MIVCFAHDCACWFSHMWILSGVIFCQHKELPNSFFLIFHHKKKIIFFSWFWCFSNSAVIWQFHLEALFLWSYSHWRHDWGWMMQFYGWQLVLEVGGRHWFHSVNLLECPHGMGTGLFRGSSPREQSFYDQASEVPRGDFHLILLDTQAGSNLVWKGHHKGMKARRSGSLEACYHSWNL